MNKTYLGDGAYAQIDPNMGSLVLTAENGIEATDTIVFDPEFLLSLLDYIHANFNVPTETEVAD